jgi:hypothetical protein
VRIYNKKTIILSILLAVLAIALALREKLAPSDLVEVKLEKIPSNVVNIYLVAKRGKDVFPMQWYQSMVYYFLADPKDAGEQWYWTVRGSDRLGRIKWAQADSYGVLARLKSGDWVIWWLRPEDIHGPTPWRYILGGGERVTIQVLGAESAKEAPAAIKDKVKHD